VTRYAAACKRDSEPLHRFIRRKGGIIACLGQIKPTRSDGRAARNR
jgi:hypothetical protein